MAVLKKNAKGYGYKYTDIAEINASLEEMGIEYYQYVESTENGDYIYTVPIVDGKELEPRRGCRIVIPPFDKKSNPAQEQGAGITYARRYSLLMAFGFATADDDAQCMSKEKSIPGYPDASEMLDYIKKRYPSKSEERNKLLKAMEVNNIEDLTVEQISQVYEHLKRGK